MNKTLPAAPETQKIGLEDQLSWVGTAIDDLHRRACALEWLVDSSLRLTTEGDSVADGDDAALVVTVRLDRAAWLHAIDAATPPRPAFPGAPAPPAV